MSIDRWSIASPVFDTAAMEQLPSRDVMYRALADRDRTFEGVFFVAVRTTSVFCRPGCPARTPMRANVEFFGSVAECLHAGYRPCRRCHPLEPAARPPDWVERARRMAEEHVDRRLGAADLRAADIDPVRVARYFRTHYGMTFQAYHRAYRMGLALRGIRAGATVGAAADATGYESESGFRSAFVAVFGRPPTRVGDAATDLRARWLSTPLGPMLAIASADGIVLFEFVDRRGLPAELAALRRETSGAVIPGDNGHLDRLADWLGRYFAGTSAAVDLPLALRGSPFQRSVWTELSGIPAGQTRSYAELAATIGAPRAVRAVARANGANRLALLIPCHRVVGSDGSPTGYGGGVWRKRWLLEHERRHWAVAAQAVRTA